MKPMTQTAPFPEALNDLLSACRYRPGWTMWLEDADRDYDVATGDVIGSGLTLVILTKGYNAYHPERGETYAVHHYFIVPAATYNQESWRRWLFEQFVKVETHEAMEFFVIDEPLPVEAESVCELCDHQATRHDGRDSTCHECPPEEGMHRFVQDPDDVEHVRPYAPNHGPGHDPYTVRELTTDEARRTSFRGVVKPVVDVSLPGG